MDSSFDSLIAKAKQENTVISYLHLFQAYKSSQKFYSAQQTLERCLEKSEASESPAPSPSEISLKLRKECEPLEDFPKISLKSKHDFFLVYGLLGDILLILKKPEESLSYLLNACDLYSPSSPFNQNFYINVVLGSVLECSISLMMKFLYAKDYLLTMKWKENTEWLIKLIQSSPESGFKAEKINLLLANFYFIQFSWYGKTEDFELCESFARDLDNLEIRFVLSYYKDKREAKAIARQLVINSPGISLYWTWLALVEDNYNAKVNSVNQAILIDKSNWAAWVTLGIVQASRGDFVAAAKTWKIAHHFNHTDSALWVLNSFIYKEARNVEKALMGFKMACDMDPSLWLTIEGYLLEV